MSTPPPVRPSKDNLFVAALAALRRARKRAEAVARATGTDLVESVDGKPVRVPPPVAATPDPRKQH